MKIPKGSIDNEHRVPDTPNGSEKVAQPKPKAKSHSEMCGPITGPDYGSFPGLRENLFKLFKYQNF